jgi:hypothetical protein
MIPSNDAWNNNKNDTILFPPKVLYEFSNQSYCAPQKYCVVLAVMCICVIYKFLSLGLWSAAGSGQAKLENSQAKPLAWEAVQASHVTWWVKKTRSALRKEQGWTHSLQCWQRLDALVCIKYLCWLKRMIRMCFDYSNHMFMWMTDLVFLSAG